MAPPGPSPSAKDPRKTPSPSAGDHRSHLATGDPKNGGRLQWIGRENPWIGLRYMENPWVLSCFIWKIYWKAPYIYIYISWILMGKSMKINTIFPKKKKKHPKLRNSRKSAKHTDVCSGAYMGDVLLLRWVPQLFPGSRTTPNSETPSMRVPYGSLTANNGWYIYTYINDLLSVAMSS